MIDLVAVAAIVGILAAIALPAYQDNTSRAQMFKPGTSNMQRVSHLDTVPNGAATATMTGSLPAATSLRCR